MIMSTKTPENIGASPLSGDEKAYIPPPRRRFDRIKYSRSFLIIRVASRYTKVHFWG